MRFYFFCCCWERWKVNWPLDQSLSAFYGNSNSPCHSSEADLCNQPSTEMASVKMQNVIFPPSYTFPMCILYYPTAKLKHVNRLVTVRPVSDTDPKSPRGKIFWKHPSLWCHQFLSPLNFCNRCWVWEIATYIENSNDQKKNCVDDESDSVSAMEKVSPMVSTKARQITSGNVPCAAAE